jgi:hypothetical protein
MKLIIAGLRDYTPTDAEMDEAVKFALGETYKWGKPSAVTEVVSGKASGVDAAGEAWAKRNNVPVKDFPADWDKHGKAAGPIRNREMAEYGDILVAFWDGNSKGTGSMIKEMNALAKQVYIFKPKTKQADIPKPRTGL